MTNCYIPERLRDTAKIVTQIQRKLEKKFPDPNPTTLNSEYGHAIGALAVLCAQKMGIFNDLSRKLKKDNLEDIKRGIESGLFPKNIIEKGRVNMDFWNHEVEPDLWRE